MNDVRLDLDYREGDGFEYSVETAMKRLWNKLPHLLLNAITWY